MIRTKCQIISYCKVMLFSWLNHNYFDSRGWDMELKIVKYVMADHYFVFLKETLDHLPSYTPSKGIIISGEGEGDFSLKTSFEQKFQLH